MKDISQIRYSYNYGFLYRKNLPENPLDFFSLWLDDAYKKIKDPMAMCLATTNKLGFPFQRMVLLKYFDKKNIIFFTNLKSRKANHLLENPFINLLIYWNILERQIIFSGKAKKLKKVKAKKYFYSRPYESQISAWASRQSEKIKNRNILKNRFKYYMNKFKKYKKIPYPNFWGGYIVKIYSVEFWQGRKNRLHDRFLYFQKNKKWNINRISP